MAGVTVELPRLIKIWPDFAQVVGVGSRPAAYAAADTLPAELKCRIGTRVRIHAGKLAEWLASGGHAKKGA